MFAPSAELVSKYAEGLVNDDPDARHRATQELIKKYVIEKFIMREGISQPEVMPIHAHERALHWAGDRFNFVVTASLLEIARVVNIAADQQAHRTAARRYLGSLCHQLIRGELAKLRRIDFRLNRGDIFAPRRGQC